MATRPATFALIGSAALNLFLVGALAGVVGMGLRMSHAHSAARPLLGTAAMSLTPSDRAKLMTNLRSQAATVRPLNAEARGLRRDAWAALGEPTLNPNAVKDALAKARGLDQQARGAVEDSVVDFAAALPAGERGAFGQAMARAMVAANRSGGPEHRPFWRRP
jgi:uncharacterized membrane protein